MRSFIALIAGLVIGAAGFGGYLYLTGQWRPAASRTQSISQTAQGPSASNHPAPPQMQNADLEKLASTPVVLPPVEPPTPDSDLLPSGVVPSPAESKLESKQLGSPIANLKPSDLQDTYDQTRGGTRRHEAIDIMEPKGTPVLAVDQGNIVKLFNSKLGGLTIYQFDDAQQYCYYYAHLDRYAPALKEGMLIRKGDVIAYVGTTGDASEGAPHLHFSMFVLGPEKHWWQGTPVNPYKLLLRAAQNTSR